MFFIEIKGGIFIIIHILSSNTSSDTLFNRQK